MKLIVLRALTALLVAAPAIFALAQTPVYEDGSEADVFYYAAEEETPAAEDDGRAPHASDELQAVSSTEIETNEEFETNEPEFEPGVVEPSSYMHGECDRCGGQAGGCQCDDCCDCGDCCGDMFCNPGHGFWGRGEYLMWWMSGATAPPLVTTSPDDTPINEAGRLPEAEILFPTERLGIDGRPGGRFTLGYWCDDAQSIGIEGNYFFLDKAGAGFQASSDDDGSPILARPFIDAATGDEDAILVAYPDVFAGTVTVASSSDILGAEANLRKAILGDRHCRLDLLAGYRFLQVHESLSVFQNQISIDPGSIIPLGTQFSIQDNFVTRNEFHGGQVGMIVQKQHRRWTLEGLGKVAFGAWNQQVRIGGFTSIAIPNEPVEVEEGGILALGSNSGTFKRNTFTAIPEAGLNLRYQLTQCWKLNVGYTFLYLPRIVRPANNIDRRIDTNQFPPLPTAGTFPEFKFKESDAWLQGVNVGVECRF